MFKRLLWQFDRYKAKIMATRTCRYWGFLRNWGVEGHHRWLNFRNAFDHPATEGNWLGSKYVKVHIMDTCAERIPFGVDLAEPVTQEELDFRRDFPKNVVF